MIAAVRLFLLALCVVLAYQQCPKLVTDFSLLNCIGRNDENESFYYDLDINGCIPKCKKYSEEIYRDCSSTLKCMPGYICERRCGPDDNLKQNECDQDSDCPGQNKNSTIKCSSYCMTENQESCMAYYINTQDYKNTYWTAQRFKPSCKNDGTWQAKQCKGGVTGRCMCFDSQGTRLFGEALYENSENMTCACSARKADLLATGKFSYISFHCDSMGNYEELQCDQISQQCWCVDTKTGDLNSVVVPQSAVQLLHCYTESQFGSQYLRQCESKKFAQTIIERKLKMHGIKYVTTDFLLCDDDGSYGAYSIETNIAYCTWRNNSKISSYQVNIQTGIGDINCRCARDYYVYGQSQICTSGGNYKPLQHNINNYYCVDLDGFAKSNFLSDSAAAAADDSICSQYY